MTLSFISDLALQSHGGGSYVVGYRSHEQLEAGFGNVPYRHIPPDPPWVGGMVSKLRRRILGWPGSFAFFAESALRSNARRVEQALAASAADAVFFRSGAPWSAWRADRPYFVYLDGVFHTFFHNTFRECDFIGSDLRRIWDAEAGFLEGAEAVMFESRWGMERAVEAYGLSARNLHAVGRGGVIDPPERDAWDGESLTLVSMAMKFRQKGGDLIAEAYRRLKERHPRLGWHILGGPPDPGVLAMDGVVYEGMLRPDLPSDLARIRGILAGAFLLMHPTREDINPLVLTEAAYFGCPAISVRRFAIPELVADGESGLLIGHPPSADDLVCALERLLGDRDLYLRMRREARERALREHHWDQVGARIRGIVGKKEGRRGEEARG